MPESVRIEDSELGERDILIATVDELIEFVNKIREAGGADVIEALFPSVMGDEEACLIAKALNFQCSVGGSEHHREWAMLSADITYDHKNYSSRWLSGNYVWVMKIHHGAHIDSIVKAKEIAGKLELPCIDNELLLPEVIGNSALAFDKGVAFTDYAVDFDTQQ